MISWIKSSLSKYGAKELLFDCWQKLHYILYGLAQMYFRSSYCDWAPSNSTPEQPMRLSEMTLSVSKYLLILTSDRRVQTSADGGTSKMQYNMSSRISPALNEEYPSTRLWYRARVQVRWFWYREDAGAAKQRWDRFHLKLHIYRFVLDFKEKNDSKETSCYPA